MGKMSSRQSKLEKEREKATQDRLQAMLSEMLKDEDNKYCVDCDNKGPRWVSWNLGIFLCIRCAGIHRNLGVHISKVRSVNLDSWTPQQVASVQQMQNSKARAIYEANLPEDFRRPQTDSAVEAFIRQKCSCWRTSGRQRERRPQSRRLANALPCLVRAERVWQVGELLPLRKAQSNY